MPSIHRIILYRLLAAWVVMSLLIGAVVSWAGLARIDRQLAALATAELRKFTAANLALLAQPETARHALDELRAQLAREHFIAGEFQDRDRRRLAAMIDPQYAEKAMEIVRLAVELPLDQRRQFRKFTTDGQGGLRVLVPFRTAGGEPAGYFEGAFLIDPDVAARLREEMVATLLVALAAVGLTTLCLYPIILALNRNVTRQSRDLLAGNIELMEVVGSAVAKRDSATSMHNYRVATYAVRLAETLGLGSIEIRDLVAGAFLHDVGKIGICDQILLKSGPLDADEFEVMKRHVTIGVEILLKSKWLLRARDVVEFHHERYDGSGYPRGLAGEDIPLLARIFAVVDVFDALTSIRPYKDALAFGEAMEVVCAGSGRLFDPRIADAFCGIAATLYRDTRGVPEAEVEERLQRMIARYFAVTP